MLIRMRLLLSAGFAPETSGEPLKARLAAGELQSVRVRRARILPLLREVRTRRRPPLEAENAGPGPALHFLRSHRGLSTSFR